MQHSKERGQAKGSITCVKFVRTRVAIQWTFCGNYITVFEPAIQRHVWVQYSSFHGKALLTMMNLSYQ